MRDRAWIIALVWAAAIPGVGAAAPHQPISPLIFPKPDATYFLRYGNEGFIKHASAGFLLQGCSLVSQGRLDEAIQAWDHAIFLDPTNAIAYTNRGTAKHDRRQFDQAISDFNRAIRLNPKRSAAVL